MANKKLIYSVDFKKTLHEKIKQYAHGSPQRNMLYAVLQWLDKEPRIDAEPVRHGRWSEIDEGECGHLMECSVCKEWLFHNFDYISNYCPNCGAKMDAEVTNG